MMYFQPDDLEQRAIDAVREYGGNGLLPATAQRLNLDGDEYWIFFPGFEALQRPIVEQDIPPLLPQLTALLWSFRVADAFITRIMAGTVACACFGSRHLWEDMGLKGRSEVSTLLQRHFPQLGVKNIHALKWKHFLFQELGRHLKISDLRPPGCCQCDGFQNCFPPHNGNNPERIREFHG